MAKFCGNCGYQSDDTAVVCGNCGTPLEGAAPVAAKKFTLDPKLVKFGGLALAAIVVIVVLCIVLFSGGYKGVIDDYLDALAAEDGATYLELATPWKLEQNKESDLKKSFKEAAKDTIEDLEDEYGSDIQFSFNVTDTDVYDDEDLEDYADYIAEDIEDWEEENDKDSEIDAEKISKVMLVECDVTVKGSKKTKKEVNVDFLLVKYDGHWYVSNNPMYYF